MSLIECALIRSELIERGLKKYSLLSLFSFVHVMIMENDALVLFGLRLRELRKQRNISQEKLALLSEIARSYLGEVERGKRNIALINIYKLAKTLEVEPSELLKKPSSHNLQGG